MTRLHAAPTRDHGRARPVAVLVPAVLAAAVVTAGAGVVALGAAAYDADRCTGFPAAEPGITHRLCGPLREAYLDEYGPTGGLGAPTSEEYDVPALYGQSPGHRRVDFTDGVIDLDVATGEIVVFRGFGGVPYT